MQDYLYIRSDGGIGAWKSFTCPICKKEFFATAQHVYKAWGTDNNVCSWTCAQKSRREAAPFDARADLHLPDDCVRCQWLEADTAKCLVSGKCIYYGRCKYFLERG
ncbi:MAG: hypothetical protein J6S14_11380 [Clostridia bacterium]|nr:hypothetical protein [Clostridia bacterium]